MKVMSLLAALLLTVGVLMGLLGPDDALYGARQFVFAGIGFAILSLHDRD